MQSGLAYRSEAMNWILALHYIADYSLLWIPTFSIKLVLSLSGNDPIQLVPARVQQEMFLSLSLHAVSDFNHQIPANALLFVTLAAVAVARTDVLPSTETRGDAGDPTGSRRRLKVISWIALAVVLLYAARAAYGWVGGWSYSHGSRLAGAGDYEAALPILDHAAVGQHRPAALWLRAEAREGAWRERFAAGERSPEMDDLLERSYRDYTEAISLSPASGWYWTNLGELYNDREQLERERREVPLDLIGHGPWGLVGRPGRVAIGLIRLGVEREPTIYSLIASVSHKHV